MATQLELQKFRETIKASPQRQQFVEKFNALDETKKEIAIQRVLSQAPTVKAEEITKPRFIRGQELVEKKVAARGGPGGGAVETLREEVATPFDFKKHPVKSVLKPLVTGVKVLEVPVESVLSGTARAAQQIQRGEPISEVGKAFGRGFRGEEIGSIKDIPVGVGIPPAVVEGFTAAIGLVGVGTALKGGVRNTWRNWVTWRRAAKAKGIQINRSFFLKQAKKLGQGLQNIQKQVFDKADEIYSPIIRKKVGVAATRSVNSVLKTAPRSVTTSLNKTNPTIVSKLKKGNGLTVGELKTVKSALGRKAFSKARHFSDVPTEEQQVLQQSYWKVKGALDEVAVKNGVDTNELKNLNSSLTNFYNTNKKVGRLIYDAQGNVKTSELVGILKEGNQGKLEILYNFGDQYFAGAFDVMNAISRYQKIQRLKNIGLKIGGGIAATEVIRRQIRNIGAQQQ